MREMKLAVIASGLLAVAVRTAALFGASVALLLATTMAASADPDQARPDVAVTGPATADTEAGGSGISHPDEGSASEPEWERCLADPDGNMACFDDYGDRFIVYDGEDDGASAAADWWTDYGREGVCYNSMGYGTEDVCNYNMREEGRVCWQVCTEDRSQYLSPLLCYYERYECKDIDGD